MNNLTFATSNGFIGRLSGRKFKTTAEAEVYETLLLDLATDVLGRKPTDREINRRQTEDHPRVPRRERPPELRHIEMSTSTGGDAPSREEQIRAALDHARQKAEDSSMSPREKRNSHFIRVQELRLAELHEQEDIAAQLDEIRRTDEWVTLSRNADVLRVAAAFDPKSPKYEMTVVNEIEKAIDTGDIARAQKLSDEFRQRIQDRNDSKRHQVAESVGPTLRGLDALDALLTTD